MIQGYYEILTPAAHELLEEGSQIVQDYFDLLSPAAREIAAKENVKHLGRAVKPYKKSARRI